MITPDEIRRKAENLYPGFLFAWLQGESFFPRMIPARRAPEGGLTQAAAAIQRLRDGAKETVGYGYTVEWTEVGSRAYGRNRFPSRIVFETEGDYLRYIGRADEFASFAAAVARIRTRYPQLEPWLSANRARIVEAAADVDRLLDVVQYLEAHPRPAVFAREIAVAADTKLVERHRRLLREWLDRILPPQTIRADEEHFERRFGLRYAEPHILIRFLDGDVQRACDCPWPELSLPLHSLAAMPVKARTALVVENKVNLLTLPGTRGAVALGGLGNGVTDLRYLPWLSSMAICYWGDLDVEGLVILSRLRSLFPQTRSLLMDEATLMRCRDLAVAGTGRPGETPPGLSASEQAAFAVCASENLRLEQERLPQTVVTAALESVDL